MANENSSGKPNPIPKKNPQLSLKEYQALKVKEAKKSLETRLPWPVKIFLAFPLLILCFILCFGIFCLPRVKPLGGDNTSVEENQ